MIALTFQRAIQSPLSYISNPFGSYYQIRPGVWNYHSSIDIIFREGSIMGCPIYSVSWGTVIYAARVTQPGYTVFGNLIVVKTDLLNGSTVYCRYAHHDHTQVKVGDIVYLGQHLADVSDAFGAYAPHLDFAISKTNILASCPWDWPGADLQRVYDHYVDPCRFIEEHSQMPNDITALKAAFHNLRMAHENEESALEDMQTAIDAFGAPEPPAPIPQSATVINATGANIRQGPTISSKIMLAVKVNTKLTVLDTGIDADSHRWMQVTVGPEGTVNGFVAKDLLSFP